MSALDDIVQGVDEIRRSAFVSGHTKKSYKDANSGEAAKVFGYLAGGPAPAPWPATLMGSGLSKLERGHRQLAAPSLEPNQAVSTSTAKVTA